MLAQHLGFLKLDVNFTFEAQITFPLVHFITNNVLAIEI